MNLKSLAGIQRTNEFLGKSVKKQNPNIILEIFRESSNYKTFGIKDTCEISDEFIKKLLDSGYSWNTIDNSTDRGRAVDLKLLNPITGKLMVGSSSGTAINVLYGLNTIGIGTDGGGSILGPAISLNLYSILLSGVGLKGKGEKKSTDSINFTPGIGIISQSFSELEYVSKLFLSQFQEKIQEEEILTMKDFDFENFQNREEMMDFLKKIFKAYKGFIYLEKDIEFQGLGDSVLGVMGEKANKVQYKANKGFLKVLNMLNYSAISIPTSDIGCGVVIVVPKGEQYLKSLIDIAKTFSQDKRPNLYKEYFLNYPLKKIDNRDFEIWR